MDKTGVLILFCALALLAGCVMALQPAINYRLSKECAHPIQAGIISFGTGFLALVAIGLMMRVGLPSFPKLSALPWWAWTGGLCGTYMVTISMIAAPKLGATRWIALVLTGQIALSLAMDHFGWLDYPQQAINWPRMLGITLVVTGVAIVMRN